MTPRSSFLTSLVCLVAGVAFLTGCSSKPKNPSTAKGPISGTDLQIFLGDTVEKNFDPHVIMKRGESFFEREEFAEAIVEYQHFLDLHRTHVLAPYAQFKLAESHFKMATTIDRDPEPIYKAMAAWQKLRKGYPGSRYDTAALEHLDRCHDWLAQSFLFVGKFYYRRESFLAAAHRFEQVIREYPDRGLAPEALYYLALSYREMGADDWAAEKLVQLARTYPDSKFTADGKQLLAKLGGSPPETALRLTADLQHPSSSEPAPIEKPSASASPAPKAFPVSLDASPGKSVEPSTPSKNGTHDFVSCRLGAWC